MLYILVNKEDYDCYTVDVAYPIELESKTEFWDEFLAMEIEARQYDLSSFKVKGYEYYDDPRYNSHRPDLFTLDEWVLHCSKRGIGKDQVHEIIDANKDLPRYVKIVEDLGSWWKIEVSDEKGNWIPSDILMTTSTIKDYYKYASYIR